MTEKYIDPNSGAAPQPGGYAVSPESSDEAGEAREAAINDAVSTPETEDVEPTPDAEDVAAANVAGAPDPDAEGLVLTEDGQSTQSEADAEADAEVTEGDSNPRVAEGGELTNVEGGTPYADDAAVTEADGKQTDVAEETEGANPDAEPADTETGQVEAPATENVPKPRGNDSRADWVTYAKCPAGGSNTDEQLEGMTRDEIRDLYA